MGRIRFLLRISLRYKSEQNLRQIQDRHHMGYYSRSHVPIRWLYRLRYCE